MAVVLIGLNHRRAPLSLRQSLALDTAELPQVLAHLDEQIANGVSVCTCIWTEL